MTLSNLSGSALVPFLAFVLSACPGPADDDDTPEPLVLSVSDLDVETDEDVELVIELPAAENPAPGLLSYTITVQPVHGGVSGDGSVVVYTPAPDYYGEDSFTFSVSDGSSSASGEVRITVASVVDPPVAVDDSAAVEEDTPTTLYVLANDYHPEGLSFALVATGTPDHGLAEVDGNTVRYSPDPDYSGLDTFTYIVEDESGLTATGEVSVSVGAVADGPVAVDDSFVVLEDITSPLGVLANDYHPDGALLSIESVGDAEFGSLTIDGESVVYTPGSEFTGEDSFEYTIIDVAGMTSTAEVSVTVTAAEDAPIAVVDLVGVDEDSSVTISPLLNDVDPENDPITLDAIGSPSHGQAVLDVSAGTVFYTPDANYYGADSLTYEISDSGGLTSQGQITITVASVNDQPSAPDLNLIGSVGSPLTVTVSGTDVEGDPLTFLMSTSPSFGNVSTITSLGQDSAQFVYTPTSVGIDALNMTVSDPAGGVGQFVVTITNGGSPVVLSGTHQFDTDAGLLDGSSVDGWDGATWATGDFSLLPGASLDVLGSSGLSISVVGDAEILGSIDLSGGDGGNVSACDNVPSGSGGAPGAGGYAGGSGAPSPTGGNNNGVPGGGSGGGSGGTLSSGMATGGGGGAHQTAGDPGLRSDGLVLALGGSPYTSLPPLQGGSGGGGGSVESDGSLAENDSGAGGGGGGGALTIVATGDLTVGASALIDASGGDGGYSSCSSGGGAGGAGAGGAVELLAGTQPIVSGTIDVSGGLGDSSNAAGGDGGEGYLVVGTTN